MNYIEHAQGEVEAHEERDISPKDHIEKRFYDLLNMMNIIMDQI